MGTISNWAVVFAQIYIEGSKFSPAPFLVQLRDSETHMPMKGIRSGDMGPKLGWNSKENGWMQFDHVRIPRTQMLSKFVSVDREGCFSVEGDLRVLYGTMMSIRALLVE